MGAGILAIICVGETESQRLDGKALSVCGDQIAGSVPEGVTLYAIAYEPLWVIGTGRAATPDEIAEMHVHIRQCLVVRLGAERKNVRILYGGSVDPSNARDILAVPEVGGVLVGYESLKAADFEAIFRAVLAKAQPRWAKFYRNPSARAASGKLLDKKAPFMEASPHSRLYPSRIEFKVGTSDPRGWRRSRRRNQATQISHCRQRWRVRARFNRLSAAFTILSAVNLDDWTKTPRVAKLPQSPDFRQHVRQEILAAKAGIDGHDKNDIAEVEDLFDQLGRARRVEHHACLLTEVVDCERTPVMTAPALNAFALGLAPPH